MGDSPRCVIVGPGRTRNGLGPFFARYLAEAGVEVQGGVGRDLDRTRAACEGIERITGTHVAPYDDLEEAIRDSGATIVVIASPAPFHEAHLEVATRHPVDVLCEKPFIAAGATPDRADALVDALAADGRLLVENCQWTWVLPGFTALAGRTRALPAQVSMRLSPSGIGRAMLDDSASHLVSVLQELAEPAGSLELDEIGIETASDEAVDVRCVGRHPSGCIDVAFELRRVRTQPRPAWIEVDGFRAERVVDPSTYAMRLRAQDGREVPLEDPLRALVYGFVADHRARDLDRFRTHADRIRARARLYADLVDAWPSSR